MLFWLGALALVTSCLSLVLQLIKTYKTKSASDLSLWMLLNFLLCSLAWVGYGVVTNDGLVYLTNLFTALCSLFLLLFKYRYREKCK